MFSDPTPLPIALPNGPLTKQLKTAVELELSKAIPDGKKGAIVAIANHEGATVAVATKLGDSWKLGGSVTQKWGGGVSGQVMVVGTW